LPDTTFGCNRSIWLNGISRRCGSLFLFFISRKVMKEHAMKPSDQQLHLVLLSLQSCQAILAEKRCDTADILAIAVLDLRMKLNGITDSELKALCEHILDEQSRLASETAAEHPRQPRALRALALAQDALKRSHASA